jgi:hypothetical protein
MRQFAPRAIEFSPTLMQGQAADVDMSMTPDTSMVQAIPHPCSHRFLRCCPHDSQILQHVRADGENRKPRTLFRVTDITNRCEPLSTQRQSTRARMTLRKPGLLR